MSLHKDQAHCDTGCHSLRLAVFGMLVLALGIGMGRFLYSPMLPLMLKEGIFDFVQLSWLASINYAGYLAGSLLFSFGAFHHTNHSRVMLLFAATATTLLILLMVLFTQFSIILLVRFLAGVASAGMMIFGSMLVLQHTRHPVVIASLFAGVGTGIFLGNEYVNAGLHYNLRTQTLWLGATLVAGLMLIGLILLLPPQSTENTPVTSVTAGKPVMHGWQLALLYGLAGFGYIIIATYLPLMAKGTGDPRLGKHLWSLVGLAIIPGCYGWLWAARRWGILQCLSANLVIQGGCVLLTLCSDSTLLFTLSCIGFGATFMGTTSLVMPLAKQLRAPRNINLLGAVTLTYGIGQIIGPLLTSALSDHADGVTTAIVFSAAALVLAAGISVFCLYRNRPLIPAH